MTSELLADLIVHELWSIPADKWGFFFPAHIALWRFIRSTRPEVAPGMHDSRTRLFESRVRCSQARDAGPRERIALQQLLHPFPVHARALGAAVQPLLPRAADLDALPRGRSRRRRRLAADHPAPVTARTPAKVERRRSRWRRDGHGCLLTRRWRLPRQRFGAHVWQRRARPPTRPGERARGRHQSHLGHCTLSLR